jgi:hypothetical protein
MPRGYIPQIHPRSHGLQEIRQSEELGAFTKRCTNFIIYLPDNIDFGDWCWKKEK